MDAPAQISPTHRSSFTGEDFPTEDMITKIRSSTKQIAL